MTIQKRLPSLASRRYLLLSALLVGILALFMSLPTETALMQSGTIGYQDFQFGASCQQKPSGEKAQSKVWWTDNSWWGVLCSPNSDQRIYRLNLATQTWVDTGVQVESRTDTRTEVMWDQGPAKLYVITHLFAESGDTGSQPVNLYRFSYNAGTDSYTLDSGFPTVVATGKPEVIVLAKDSTGQLWVAYVVGSKAMVNRSTTNEQTWGTPFIIPVDSAASSVTSDDIATIVAFQGKIGVMWSDQGDDKFYFSIHQDSAADQTWLPVESAWQQSGNISDDHLSIQADSTGRLFVGAKTSLGGSDPLTVMLVRQTNGQWSTTVFGTGSQNHTRPIVVLDEGNNLIHMFATLGGSGCCIVQKSSSLTNPSFPSGNGTIVIDSDSSTKINNVQSTDNGVTNASGLLLIASDYASDRYFHAYLPIGGGNPPTPTDTPTDGPSPTPTFTHTPTSTFTPTPPPGPEMSFTATDDAHVKSDSPNSNYGSLDNLRTRGVVSPIYDAYLKFTVSGLPSGVTRATLRLFSYDGSPNGGSIYSVSNLYQDGSAPWVESNLRYNNAPAFGGSPLSSYPATIPNNSWVEYDVTAAVIGNGTFSFAISSNTSNSLFFNSSEAASNQPVLVVEYGGPTLTPTNTFTPSNTPTPSHTPTVTPTFTPTDTPGPQSNFSPSDDAHVKSDSPNNNYGSADNLRTRGVTAPLYTAYLKFNVTGVGSSITSATLRLFSYDGSPNGGSIYLVSNDYLDGSAPWVESNLRYNNAPAVSGDPLSSYPATIPNNSWVEYDVTSAITGDGTYSFAIVSTSTNSLFFNSSEAASNLPVLVIQTGGDELGLIGDGGGEETTPTDTSTPTPTLTPTGTPGPQMAVEAADDAHVKSSSAASNYGSQNHLRTRGVDGTLYNAYLKFVVSGLPGEVARATLRLYAYDGSPNGGAIYSVLNDYLDGSAPWTESDLRYNNAPAISGDPLSSHPAAIPDNTWVEYDVTAAITGDGTYSFAIVSSTTNSLFFNSSEAPDNVPVLIIETGDSVNMLMDGMVMQPQVVQSLNVISLFDASGQCLEGELLYTITNLGDPMTAPASYSVFGPSGALQPGEFGPLDIDQSATIIQSGITQPGIYTLFANVEGLVVAAECAAAPIAVETEVVTEEALPTEAPVAVLTEEPVVVPTEEATDELVPLPTFTWLPQPTEVPADTAVPPTATSELPAATATPQPLALPFSDHLDNGGALWSVNGGWILQDAALLGGTGAFWYTSLNADTVETLSLAYPLDLRTAQQPLLRFDSLLVASHSSASVEISLDGVTWQPLLSVQPSENWQTMFVDLSAYQQQTVWLRWVRLASAPALGQEADFWTIDNVDVAEAVLLLPSPTPTPSPEPIIIPATEVPSPEPIVAPVEPPAPANTSEGNASALPVEATAEATGEAAP